MSNISANFVATIMNKNITKKIAAFVLAALITGLVFASQSVVKAAGGDSPYITPAPTGEGSLDIIGLLGSVLYVAGMVFVFYGKFFNKLVNFA